MVDGGVFVLRRHGGANVTDRGHGNRHVKVHQFQLNFT